MARKTLEDTVKSVWFSGKKDKPLLTHINKIDNFSDYVKRLIESDIEKRNEIEQKLTESDLPKDIVELLKKRL